VQTLEAEILTSRESANWVTPQLPFCGSKKGMTYPPLWRFCSRGDYDPLCPETLLDKIWVGVYAEDTPVSILEL
jgi:hypothetical protein